MSLRTTRSRADGRPSSGWQVLPIARWSHYRIFFDGPTIWLRDRGEIALPVAVPGSRLELNGELLDFTKEYPTARPFPGLRVRLNGRMLGEVHPVKPGPFAWPFALPPGGVPAQSVLSLELLGVRESNFGAWMGRLSRQLPLPSRWRDRLQEYRLQKRNRQLRL